MNIILTYDVDRDHFAIKQACLRNGFADCIKLNSGDRKKLPNTTLMGDFANPQAAVDRFTLLARQASPLVKIEKVLACHWNGLWLTSNENC